MNDLLWYRERYWNRFLSSKNAQKSIHTFMCVQYSYIKTLIRVSSKLWITSSIIHYVWWFGTQYHLEYFLLQRRKFFIRKFKFVFLSLATNELNHSFVHDISVNAMRHDSWKYEIEKWPKPIQTIFRTDFLSNQKFWFLLIVHCSISK